MVQCSESFSLSLVSLVYVVANKDYMSDHYTLTLPRPISNRCLNLLGNLNLSIFTKTLWQNIARAMLSYSWFFFLLSVLDISWLFVRYKRAEDARMALEQMEGFELAGRTVWFFFLLFVLAFLKFVTSYAWTPSMKRAQLSTLNRILWRKRAVILPFPYILLQSLISSSRW